MYIHIQVFFLFFAEVCLNFFFVLFCSIAIEIIKGFIKTLLRINMHSKKKSAKTLWIIFSVCFFLLQFSMTVYHQLFYCYLFFDCLFMPLEFLFIFNFSVILLRKCTAINLGFNKKEGEKYKKKKRKIRRKKYYETPFDSVSSSKYTYLRIIVDWIFTHEYFTLIMYITIQLQLINIYDKLKNKFIT